MKSYIVATVKKWNIDEFERYSRELPGKWHLVHNPNDLTIEFVRRVSPRYIFFPHWSWIVPNELTQDFECVCFHMTDLPFGRGGSPLQNLIVREHASTKVSALRMIDTVDAGPIYMKRPLDLDGSADQIFRRCSKLISEMISEMVIDEPSPVPQSGDVTVFKRRTPDQGRLPPSGNLSEYYDLIRMLDGEGYPRAFLEFGDIKLEFSEANFSEGQLTAKVRFIPKRQA